MLGHHRDDLRERDQRLDARIPRQRLQRLRPARRPAAPRAAGPAANPRPRSAAAGRSPPSAPAPAAGPDKARSARSADRSAAVCIARCGLLRRRLHRRHRLAAARRLASAPSATAGRDQQERQNLRHDAQLERLHPTTSRLGGATASACSVRAVCLADGSAIGRKRDTRKFHSAPGLRQRRRPLLRARNKGSISARPHARPKPASEFRQCP